MRFLKKLVSKKGQLSMEMGLLVAAAVLVAVIVAYYYTTRTKVMMEKTSNTANETVQELSTQTSNIEDNLIDVASETQ